MPGLFSQGKRAIRETLTILPLLPARPVEFYDRLQGIIENRVQDLQSPPVYDEKNWTTVLQDLTAFYGADFQEQETALQQIEQHVRAEIAALAKQGPFSGKHDGDMMLGRLCYLLCRHLQPQTVIETGVARGVTSAFILAALDVNRSGTLYSIDLPPSYEQKHREFIGAYIPADFRQRWQLHIGSSRRHLPGLLKNLQSVDMFIHDSLHSYNNMLYEYRTVYPHLKSVLLSDDVGMNAAFKDWRAEASCAYSAVIRTDEKRGLLGLCLKA